MTAWRMYYRTLDEESAAIWRAKGIATETAVLATWIRREAERDGLEVHPTATPWITTIREGGERSGVCVSIPVRADPDPLHVQELEHVIVPRSPGRTATVYLLLGIFWICVAILLALFIKTVWPDPDPRAATNPTTPAAVHDLSGRLEDTSGSSLPGAPHVGGPLDTREGNQGRGLAVYEASPVEGPTTGGAPPADTLIAGRLDPAIGREGDIAHSGSRTPYVAIPLGPGIRIRVCGPAACLEVTSTDAGPNHEMLLAGRIMDLDIGRWERVCGVPARFGLCPGSWVRITGPRVTLPPTDATP